MRLGRTSLRVGVEEGRVPDEGAQVAGNPGRQEAQELLLPGLLGSAGLQGEQCRSWDMRSRPVTEERISTGRACPLPNIVKGTEARLGKPSWRDVLVRRRGFRGGCGRQTGLMWGGIRKLSLSLGHFWIHLALKGRKN